MKKIRKLNKKPLVKKSKKLLTKDAGDDTFSLIDLTPVCYQSIPSLWRILLS